MIEENMCFMCGIRQGKTKHHAIPQRLNPVHNKTVPLCIGCHRVIHNSIRTFDEGHLKRIPQGDIPAYLKRKIKFLENKINRQKQILTQYMEITKEIRFLFKSKKREILSDLKELMNKIGEDMEIDLTGEFGYRNEKEVVRAIRSNSFVLLKRKIEKWEKLRKVDEENVNN